MFYKPILLVCICFATLPSVIQGYAEVAQLVEQLFCKQRVAGSSPVFGSKVLKTKIPIQEAT